MPTCTSARHRARRSPTLGGKAINKGIDRKAISDAVYGGSAVPATKEFKGHKYDDRRSTTSSPTTRPKRRSSSPMRASPTA